MADMNNDITNFIAQTIEVGGIYKVSTDENKFISSSDSGEVIEVELPSSEKRPLAIYGTNNSSVYIINPFNEGESRQAITSWYYHTRNLNISSILLKIMFKILEAGLRSNDKKAKHEKDDVLKCKYLGQYTSKVDEKLLKEVSSFISKPSDFLNIYYNKTDKICRVNCILFKEKVRKLYPSFRKQTWEILESLVKKLLDCDDLTVFDYKPDNPNIPVFESFITVYVDLLRRLEKPAKLIDIDLSDWKNIKEYLPYLNEYYKQARWCTDCVNSLAPTNANTLGVLSDMPQSVVQAMAAQQPAVAPVAYTAPVGNLAPDAPLCLRQMAVAQVPPPMMTQGYVQPVNLAPDAPLCLRQMYGQ